MCMNMKLMLPYKRITIGMFIFIFAFNADYKYEFKEFRYFKNQSKHETI